MSDPLDRFKSRPAGKFCNQCGNEMVTFNTGKIVWCSICAQEKAHAEITAQKIKKEYSFKVDLKNNDQSNEVILNQKINKVATEVLDGYHTESYFLKKLRDPSQAILYWMDDEFTTMSVQNNFKPVSCQQYIKELLDQNLVQVMCKRQNQTSFNTYNVYGITKLGRKVQGWFRCNKDVEKKYLNNLKP